MLLNNIQDEFEMDDGEICWSDKNLSDSVHTLVLAVCENTNKPTVITKNQAKGVLVWLNSGDKNGNRQCSSLLQPNIHLVSLLINAINHREDIFAFNHTETNKSASANSKFHSPTT